MDYEGKICRPSFEKKAFKLPISVGCSYNQCKFCCLFKYLNFKEIDDKIVFEEIDKVKKVNGTPTICFLGDGNAFHNKTERLVKIITYLKDNIKTIKSIRMDATITDIKQKTDEELKILSNLGVEILYIGIESGLDDVLKFMNKEHRTNEEAKGQIKRLEKYNIHYAAHIMAGVAGKGRGIENAEKIAQFFNETKPVNITNFTMFTSKKQKLYEDVLQNKFIPATELESLYEIKKLIEDIKVDTHLDSFHDYLPFRVKGYLPDDKEKMINQIDKMIQKLLIKDNIKIYIATNSQNEEDIIKRIGIDYKIIKKADGNDLSNQTFDKEKLIEESKNVCALSFKLNNLKNDDKMILVASKKAVVLDNVILSKPKDREEAYLMLKNLSGRSHFVYLATCIFYDNKYYTKLEEAEVIFRNLSDEEIYKYVDTVQPFDKDSGYDIQDEYFDFEDYYTGDYNTLIGFSFKTLINFVNENKLTKDI